VTTTPTTTSRLVEATQFTIQDYEIFKTGTKFDNKFRQAAMEKMALDEKDPKSELNKLGFKEVRRVRVLREAGDTEGTNLTLVYETKTDKRTLEMAAYKKDQQKAADVRYTFPVWIADAKVYLKAVFTELVEWVDAKTTLADPHNPERNVQKDIADQLEVLCKKMEESKLSSQELAVIRVDVYKILHSHTNAQFIPNLDDTTAEDWPKEKLEKVQATNAARSELFLRLDFLSSALCFLPKPLFDKSSLLTYATSLRPPRQAPKGNAGRPPRENKGNEKPQNRQHRNPKSAEKPRTQA